MNIRESLRAVPRRLQNPFLLAFTLAYFAVNIGSMFMVNLMISGAASPDPPPRFFNLSHSPHVFLMTSTYLFACLHLFAASPLPWQWTGDARKLASPLRGVLQTIVQSGLLSLLSLAVTWPVQRAQLKELAHILPSNFIPYLIVLGWLVGCVIICVIGFAIAFWEKCQVEKAEAERQAQQARWTLLKAQMSPHVLLNSLNGLAELVRDDTQAAIKGMRDLAEIYHQLLSLGEAPTVPLAKERQLLERYLSVEQMRLGGRLHVEWDWDPLLDKMQVMPLLLQPLVENAIKHGVAADPKGGRIVISGHLHGMELQLDVANTGGPSFPLLSKGGGVGLRNLRSRLELAYRGKANFSLVQESPWTKAELRLPLPKEPVEDPQ